MNISKTIITIMAAMAICHQANAQFVIYRNDNSTQTLPGNARFATSDEGENFSLGGIPLSDIKSLQRVKREGAVILDRQVVLDGFPESIYLQPAYGQPQALFLAVMSNDKLVGYHNTNIPKHPGGYVFSIGFACPKAADSRNPILPEGTYPICPDGMNPMTIDASFTWAIHNVDGTTATLKEIFLDKGNVTVKHLPGNEYDISGTMISSLGEEISMTYTGPITFFNPSAPEDEGEKFIKEDMAILPQYASDMHYVDIDTETYEQHVIRIFTTTNLTSDRNHCAEAGTKMQIAIYTSKDGSLEGNYTMAPLSEDKWSVVDPQPGKFSEGVYHAGIPFESYLEQVVSNSSTVKTAIVSGGTMKISKAGTEPDVYNIKVDFTISNPEEDRQYKATCDWTGKIERDSVTQQSPGNKVPAANNQ